MKAVLLLLALSLQAFGACASSWSNGYIYCRTITIDHTKVPNTDQGSFPVLVSGTYSYLATVANGGLVQSSSGYDVIFTSDNAGATPLNWEQETWTAASGLVNYWVKVGTVSHTSDTVFYMFYGNGATASFQGNATSAWDSNYVGVWHLPNGTSLTANDSTSHALNGTLGTTTPTAVAAQVDGGASFSGADINSNITIAHDATMDNTRVTVSAWVKTTMSGALGNMVDRDNGVTGRVYQFRINTSNKFEFIPFDSGGTAHVLAGATTINNGAWRYLVGTYDGTNVNVYVNGAADASALGAAGNLRTALVAMQLGKYVGDATQMYIGSLDEVRYSAIARSADWIATEYNNQSSPSTFYTIGTQANSAGAFVSNPSIILVQ